MTEAEEEEFSTTLIPDLYKPPALLPIAQLKDSLLYAIETHPVTIIVSISIYPKDVKTLPNSTKVGDTGSGKTTQIPQFLYKAGWTNDGSQIAVTQVSRGASTQLPMHHQKPSMLSILKIAAQNRRHERECPRC
jgi:ATP-dependent RNA helicase DDX35